MLKLKKLSIKKHPMLDVPIDLSFSDRENILVGINGSGKTTLLELIRSCLSGDFSQFKYNMSEVELFYRLSYNRAIIDIEFKRLKVENTYFAEPISGSGSSQINNLLKKEAGFEHYLKMNVSIAEKTYTLDFTKNILKIEDKEGTILESNKIDADFAPFYTPILMHYLENFNIIPSSDRIRLSMLLDIIFSLNAEYLNFIRFPEGLDYYKYLSNTARLQIKAIGNYSNDSNKYPAFINKDRITNNILENINERDLIITTQELPLLDIINKELHFHSLKLSFIYKGKETDHARPINTWEGFRIFIDIDEDTTITDDKLSYGEKRFISLMLYLEGCGDVIILDEPINGLHHNLIDTVVDKIYADDKQSFIANQNSTLFDYIDFNSAEEVKEKLILCTKKDKKMSWRNPTDDEAQELFVEVEKDFMYLGEILRIKELW